MYTPTYELLAKQTTISGWNTYWEFSSARFLDHDQNGNGSTVAARYQMGKPFKQLVGKDEALDPRPDHFAEWLTTYVANAHYMTHESLPMDIGNGDPMYGNFETWQANCVYDLYKLEANPLNNTGNSTTKDGGFSDSFEKTLEHIKTTGVGRVLKPLKLLDGADVKLTFDIKSVDGSTLEKLADEQKQIQDTYFENALKPGGVRDPTALIAENKKYMENHPPYLADGKTQGFYVTVTNNCDATPANGTKPPLCDKDPLKTHDKTCDPSPVADSKSCGAAGAPALVDYYVYVRPTEEEVLRRTANQKTYAQSSTGVFVTKDGELELAGLPH